MMMVRLGSGSVRTMFRVRTRVRVKTRVRTRRSGLGSRSGLGPQSGLGSVSELGSGSGLESGSGCVMVAYDTGCIRAMGLIYGDVSWGWPTGLGRWNQFVGGVPWGCTSLAGSGRWDWFMGTCDTGWIGAMELFHGDTRHWLEWGNGVDLWRCVVLAGTGWWDWFRGACHGGTRHWLDQGDGIDLWGYVMGAHDWIGEMGLTWGGMLLGCDTGWDPSLGCGTESGRWDWFAGGCHGDARHWLDVGDEIDLWGRSMGARNWIRAMELICGGKPWGRTTLARSGWRDWFMWARHEGMRHWLDWGYGIDSWGHVKWQSTIWLLNLNDDTMCRMSGVEVSVQSVFG